MIIRTRRFPLHSLPALVLGLCALGAAGCVEQAEQGFDSSEEALIGAPLDSDNTWSVGVCASTPNTDPARGKLGACIASGTRCSGSLIAPNLVMTARHCVEKADVASPVVSCTQSFAGPKNGEGMRVSLASSVLNENPGWIEVAQVLTPSGVGVCDNDLALLVLARNVTPQEATPIDVTLTNFAQRPLLRPATLALVSRGAVTFEIDPKTLDFTELDLGNLERRRLENIPLRCFSDVPGACKTEDVTDPSGFTVASAGQFLHGRGPALGDSGGALLTQSSLRAGKPVALGVHTIVTMGANGEPNAGLATRLDRHAAFLTDSAKQAAALGSYTAPTWALAPASSPTAATAK